MNRLQLEILNSIRNLFNSGLSSSYISKKADIAYTTVNELRNYKRSLEKVSFNTINKLYNLSVKENLNEEKLNRKRRNDLNDGINVKIKVNELIVTFKSIDLFAIGKLAIENLSEIFNKNYTIIPLENDLPKLLRLYNSVFITKYKTYYPNEFGYKFNCNYKGDESNNLVKFINEYSNIDKSVLEEIIFNRDIVIYNLEEDGISGYDSIFKNDDIDMYYWNNKLIFKLNEFDNIKPKINNLFEKEKKVNLKDSTEQILKILNIYQEVYKENTKLKSVKIINDIDACVNKIYKFSNCIIKERDCYIILIYSNFEIWLPYFLQNKENEIIEVLEKLGEKNPKINKCKLSDKPYWELTFD